MASEVQICNMALSHIGDKATVASIRPPEASAQARVCAQFYDVARDLLLEKADWTFNTRRAVLAEIENWPFGQWKHAYAWPSGALQVFAIMDKDAPSDYPFHFERYRHEGYRGAWPRWEIPTQVNYAVEIGDKNQRVILTNQCNAMARYVVKITDTALFSATFTTALSYMLASMIAGPLIKGDEGTQKGAEMLQMAQALAGAAAADDANQQQTQQPVVLWRHS